MTVLEQRVLDLLEEYGIKRKCACYQMHCLVLPYPLHKIMLSRVIREVEKYHGGIKREVKEDD